MIKGVATFLLLYHHLFRSTDYFSLYHTFSDTWAIVIQKTAHHSRVCVALFLFMSGYGLVKSAAQSRTDITFRFSLSHIFKILPMLWLIYILFVPIGFLFGKSMPAVYGADINGLWSVFTDLMGFTCIANKTWWYFRDLFLLYSLFPLFYYGIKKNPLLAVIAVSVLTFKFKLEWFLPFVMGMIFAEKDVLAPVLQIRGLKRIALAVGSFILMILCYYARTYHAEYADTFFSVSIILFVLSILSVEGLLGKFMAFVGMHSANIYMFHNFIYSKYFRRQLYWFRYPILIFLILLFSCLLISLGIEGLKKKIKFNNFTSAILTFLADPFPKAKNR